VYAGVRIVYLLRKSCTSCWIPGTAEAGQDRPSARGRPSARARAGRAAARWRARGDRRRVAPLRAAAMETFGTYHADVHGGMLQGRSLVRPAPRAPAAADPTLRVLVRLVARARNQWGGGKGFSPGGQARGDGTSIPCLSAGLSRSPWAYWCHWRTPVSPRLGAAVSLSRLLLSCPLP
jgi:hypothetical protein